MEHSQADAVTDSANLSASSAQELGRWQRKLLPYMMRFLIVLALVFFGLSIYDVYEIRSFVRNANVDSVSPQISELVHLSAAQPARISTPELVQRSLVVLEADAMDKRYRQANALLLSRIWTRQLAFLTGMVLAFIGAVFILGR